MESFEKAAARLGDVLDCLAETTSALENTLLHHGDAMSDTDRTNRVQLVERSKDLLNRIGHTQ